MRTKLRVLSLLVALGLVAAACGSSTTSSGSPDPAGGGSSDGSSSSARFTAAQLGGGEFDSATLDGQPTVLWFWAPWCTSCRAEAPDVVAAAEAFDGRVGVVGVAGRGELSAMEDFVADTGTGGLTHVVDADGDIWSAYGVFAQPAFAFLSGDGEVEVFVGGLGEEALVERMTALTEA
jgi:thiol-disulfide isomerase/thioredoxin